MSMASKYLSFSSSLLDNRLSHTKKPTHRNPNPTHFRCASTKSNTSKPSSTPKVKKRLWKLGKYPEASEPVNGFSQRNQIENVEKKLERRSKAKPWVCTVTEALSDRIAKNQWLQALQVFDMLREQSFYQPKESTYLKLLVLLSRSGQPKLARQLFEKMVEEELEPTTALYTALLLAYCRNGHADDAFSTLDAMKSLPNCQPDVVTYSTLIKMCVDNLRFDVVDSLYAEMSERGIYPNTVTQSTVLSGYCRAGRFDDMERVLSEMLDSSTCRPDAWTMNIIVSVFGNLGDVATMEKWYNKFCDFGIEPDPRTFNILISAYGKKQMYDKMSSVMECMRKLQFPWTTSTYNNVIEAFADAGDVKHMEWAFEQMQDEETRADTKTMCCLINGYANAGMYHKVIWAVQLAGLLDIPENTTFFNAVLSACAKFEDLPEMERVFTRMKKQCRLNEATFSILVDAYRKEGMNDKIFYLEQEKSDLLDVADEKYGETFEGDDSSLDLYQMIYLSSTYHDFT